MSKLFDFKQVRNKPSRNGFDLSRRFAFTAKTGEILPVCTIFTMPGDKFKIKSQHFTRTSPVQSAAFVRIREYFDWFYVPFRMLWNSWPTFITQMENNPIQAQSITANFDPTEEVPSLTRDQLLQAPFDCIQGASAPNQINAFGFKRFPLWSKLYNYFGYGRDTGCYDKDYDGPTVYNNSNIPVNIFPIAAYHKIYNDYFRNSQWEVASPFLWDFTYSGGGILPLPTKGNSYWTGKTLFDMEYSNYNKDLIMGILPYSQYGDVAEIAILANSPTQTLTGSPTSQLSINIDPQFNGVVTAPVSGLEQQLKLTPIPGAVGESIKYNVEPVGVGTAEGNIKTSGTVPITHTLSLPNYNVYSPEYETAASLSILALRQAEFLQRWKEIAQSGDQTYRDQIYRHWGVSLSDDLSDTCRWISGDSSNIDISEVLNTNFSDAYNEDGSPVSEPYIKGKAVGVSQNTFKFSCREHGVILCLYHTQPLLDYDLDNIDLQLTATNVYDFPIPEFDRIGMEELPTYALSFKYWGGVATGSNGANPVDPDSKPNTALGYVPRYAPWKTALDRVGGDFSFTLKDWVAPVDDEYITGTSTSTLTIGYNFFKVNPHLLDNIFGVESDSYVTSDQFRVNSYFDIKVVRNLDYDGMPY